MNAVQKEIADTLSKHPTWSRTQALHWNRKHNPATIARHKREKAYSKHMERVQNLESKAKKMAQNMKQTEIKKVGRTRYGNVVVKKGAGKAFTIASPNINKTVDLTIHYHSPNEFRADKRLTYSKGDSQVKEFAKAMFSKSKGKHGSSGKSSG